MARGVAVSTIFEEGREPPSALTWVDLVSFDASRLCRPLISRGLLLSGAGSLPWNHPDPTTANFSDLAQPCPVPLPPPRAAEAHTRPGRVDNEH